MEAASEKNWREHKYGVLPATSFCFALLNSGSKLLNITMQVVVSNKIVIPAFQKTIINLTPIHCHHFW